MLFISNVKVHSSECNSHRTLPNCRSSHYLWEWPWNSEVPRWIKAAFVDTSSATWMKSLNANTLSFLWEVGICCYFDPFQPVHQKLAAISIFPMYWFSILWGTDKSSCTKKWDLIVFCLYMKHSVLSHFATFNIQI